MDEMLMIMGALHRGIIPPDFCIDEALASLTTEEARIAKRKFRKMVRKMNKRATAKGGVVTVSSRSKRLWVKKECFRIGRELVGEIQSTPAVE